MMEGISKDDQAFKGSRSYWIAMCLMLALVTGNTYFISESYRYIKATEQQQATMDSLRTAHEAQKTVLLEQADSYRSAIVRADRDIDSLQTKQHVIRSQVETAILKEWDKLSEIEKVTFTEFLMVQLKKEEK